MATVKDSMILHEQLTNTLADFDLLRKQEILQSSNQLQSLRPQLESTLSSIIVCYVTAEIRLTEIFLLVKCK